MRWLVETEWENWTVRRIEAHKTDTDQRHMTDEQPDFLQDSDKANVSAKRSWEPIYIWCCGCRGCGERFANAQSKHACGIDMCNGSVGQKIETPKWVYVEKNREDDVGCGKASLFFF